MSYAIYCRLDLHVTASSRKVVAATHGLLRKESRQSRKRRTERHKLIRDMLKEHREARDEYLEEMRGHRPHPRSAATTNAA